METSEKKEQISGKIPGVVKRKLEEKARDQGLTLSEYVRMKLENDVEEKPDAGGSKQENKSNTGNPSSEKPVDGGVYFRILAAKMETTNELLEKLVESASARSDRESEEIQELGTALLEQKEELEAIHKEEISKLEEKIKAENLVLKFDDNQRNVLSKLILHRKDKGKPNSDNVEIFIGWLLKEKFVGSWGSGTPQGFDDEFKAAFPNLFENE